MPTITSNNPLDGRPPFRLPTSMNFEGQEIMWNHDHYFYCLNSQDLSLAEHERIYNFYCHQADIVNTPSPTQYTHGIAGFPSPSPSDPIESLLSNNYWNTPSSFSASFNMTLDEINNKRLPRKEKWPIGTIVKWNMKLEDITLHCKANNFNLDYPLLKILSYSSGGSINKYHDIGSVEPIKNSYDTKYFIPANVQEIAKYEEIQANLHPCETRPSIGMVLEYIGPNSTLRGKRGTVIGESRNNEMLFHWFNEVANDEIAEFKRFKIAPSQRSSFEPDPALYAKCKHCESLRPVRNRYDINIQKTVYSFCDLICIREYGLLQCGACSNWHTAENIVQTSDGNTCTGCRNLYYHACSSCEQLFQRSRLYSDTNECRYCRDNNGRIIHDHSYRPRFQFQKMAWENTRYLGIELEVELSDSRSRSNLAEDIKKWLSQQSKTLSGKTLDKLVYIKNDGSLHNGIEIVFHPFTLKAFHKNFPLQNFLKFLKDNHAIVQRNTGMHVHVSKDKLTKEQLIKGKWFFLKCEPFLKKFSEREHYDFCKFDETVLKNPYDQQYGHYSVLNLGGPDSKTMEVRIFNATLEYKKFLANLQFSDVFVDYIQHGPGSVFLRTQNENIIWQDFIEYAKRRNMYQILTSYILLNRIV